MVGGVELSINSGEGEDDMNEEVRLGGVELHDANGDGGRDESGDENGKRLAVEGSGVNGFRAPCVVFLVLVRSENKSGGIRY